MADQVMSSQPRRRPRFIHLVNKLIKLLLRSPLHGLLSKEVLLLTFTGRQSAKRYTTPVGYARDGDLLLLGTQRPWWKNLRGGVPVSVRVQGCDYSGLADVVSDEEGLRQSYRTMISLRPRFRRILDIKLDPDGQPNRDDVARAKRQGHVVVRIQLDEPAPSPGGRAGSR